MTDTERVVGQVVGGSLDAVVVRQAKSAQLVVGDLLVWEGEEGSIIMHVFNLEHVSQMDRHTREITTGMRTAGERMPPDVYEPGSLCYLLAHAKLLAEVGTDGLPVNPYDIPPLFGDVRIATARDLSFLPGPGSGRVFLGAVRSGSKPIKGTGLHMDAETLPRHVRVSGATGSGKSNLIKCMLYGLLDDEGVGALVLDARGEYCRGLSAHPKAASKLVCYTGSPTGDPGQVKLSVNVRSVTPHDFGLVELSEAEEGAMWGLWKDYGKEWIIQLLDESQDEDMAEQHKSVRAALRRKVRTALGIGAGGTFDADPAGEHIFDDIAEHVSKGRVVVLDTSGLGSGAEMMAGTLAASRILQRYMTAAEKDNLDSLPVAAVVIEEAPRVLGEDGLGSDSPFAEIIKVGRKFKIGLCAVTQPGCSIPHEIMLNLNTEIIFGNQMRAELEAPADSAELEAPADSAELEAPADSATQDLSDYHRVIGRLGEGEAIVFSAFLPFAIPIKVPLFDDLADTGQKTDPLG